MGITQRRFGWREARGLVVAACLAWVCCAPTTLVAAEDDSPAELGAKLRLLSAKEGREIVGIAREQAQPLRGAQDCSHLVHEIYSQAGLDYPYASSYDLYAGGENFARVKTPQAGDVIVWPGHAGIVLDPREHSFYSLVRSGLDTQDYSGPYWRSRGKPRFFRYVVGRRAVLEAGKRRLGVRASGTEDRAVRELSPSKVTAKDATERTVVYGPVAPAEADAEYPIPASIVIAEGRKQPSAEEAAQGISELSNASGNLLRTKDPLKLKMPIVVYERLRVERMEMKRDHGWAHVEMDSLAYLAGDQTEWLRKSEKVSWDIRRGKSGWEAVAPLDRTYVPRDVAVRILAAQLAQLTQSTAAEQRDEMVLQKEAQLARLLNGLLEKK